jgi:hypothetical protein
MLSDSVRRKKLEEQIRSFFNVSISLEVYHEKDPDGNEKSRRDNSSKKKLEEHPLVLHALDIFNARIAEVKPVGKNGKSV